MNTNPNCIPQELRVLPQWVGWKHETRNGKVTKPPVQRNGNYASSTKADTWCSFGDAVEAHREKIGFVFTESDPYVGIDLDDAKDERGILKGWAAEIVDQFDSWAETSPSGKGVHIIARGVLRGNGRKVPHQDGSIEVYDRGRYFTMTGESLNDAPIRDAQDVLDRIMADVLDDGKPETKSPASPTKPRPQPPPPSNAHATVSKPAPPPSEKLAVVRNNVRVMLSNVPPRTPDGESKRSEMDFKACIDLIEAGDSRDGAWKAVKDLSKFAEQGRRYFDITWANASQMAKQQTAISAEVPQSTIKPLSTVLEDLRNRISNQLPIIETIPTGWALLDETVGGLVRGEFLGFTAGPGVGKSTLADSIMVDALVYDHSLNAIVFALETAASVRVARMVARRCVRLSTNNGVIQSVPVGPLLRGELQEPAQQHAIDGVAELQAAIGDRLRIVDDAQQASAIAQIIETEKPDIVLIDHLGLVESDFGESDVSRCDAALARLVEAIRRTNCAAIVINEINKSALRNKQVDMSASRGSARFASLAAMYIGLHRTPANPPNTDPIVTAQIAKSRFGRPDKQQSATFFGGLSYFAWGDVESVTDEEEKSSDRN